MTSLFSFVLVIVMAFSSIGGMTANLEEPVSFDAKINMNVEALLAMTGEGGVPEDTAKYANAVGTILDAITLKGAADKESAELAIFAGNDVMLSLGVKNSEAGATLASSLLGKNAIFVSNELIEKMQQQMMSSMAQSSSGTDLQAMAEQLQSLDEEQLKKDTEEWEKELAQAIAEKKGETETGEFTVDGMTFTGKTPVNMTYTEMMELVVNKVKELLAKESFQPIIKAFGQETDLNAELDKAIEKIKNQPEEEKPELQTVIYTDADQCEYIVAEMNKTTAATEDQPASEEKVYFGFGTVDGLNRVHVKTAADKQNMDMTITVKENEDGSADVKTNVIANEVAADAVATRDAAGNIDMVENVTAKDMNAKITFKTEGAGTERTSFALNVFIGDAEKALVSVTGSAGKGGETVSAYEGEGITVIPFEKLMDQTDTSAANSLQMSLMNGVMQAFSTLVKNVPEETASWLNSQMTNLIAPSAPATEEAPQAEPAVNE